MLFAGAANSNDLPASISLPMLFTHGEKDKIVPAIVSVLATALIEGAKVSLFKNSGHAPFYDESDRFNKELLTFVKSAQQ
jgi:non-heme chloroperoxidase